MSVYDSAKQMLRLWFNSETDEWQCVRWDGKGGVVCAKKLLIDNVHIETEGRFMRVYAEANIPKGSGWQNVFFGDLIRTDILQLVPNTQKVEVPPVNFGMAAIKPS